MKFKIAKYKNFPESYEKDLEKTIEFLKNGDFKSADSKKLSNSNYFRAKIDIKGRLLFQFANVDNISYIFLLELLLNHEYESSQFLKGKTVTEEDFIFDQSNIENNLTQDKQFHYFDRFIVFNKTQENLLYSKPPLIIVGSAGSGKTSVTIEKLRMLEGKVLYISLSQELVNNAKTICGVYSNIDFLSFEEFINNIEKQDGKVIDFYTFKTWAYNNKIKEVEKYFEEFKGVLTAEHTSEYITLENYKKLGKNQSLFSEDKREYVYEIFTRYLHFLKENNIYDNNITIFQLFDKLEEIYDFIVIDEIQDFTNKEIALILQSLKNKHNFIFSGDSNQIIYSNFFSWSHLKTMLYKNETVNIPITILQENYRNSKKITNVANSLLKIKQLQFVSIDKEINYLIKTKSEVDGNVRFYEATQKNIKEINEETQNSRKVAVIVYDELTKQEIKKEFKTALIYTVQEIKGLEYDEVILVNFISHHRKSFSEIIRNIQQSDLSEDLKYSRLSRKDNENRLESYKIYINSLYVALTRGMKNLYILEKENHRVLQLLGIVKEKKEKIIVEQSSSKEWEEEAQKLEKMGKFEQVEEIRKKQLKSQKPEIKDRSDKEDFSKLKDEALNPNRFNKKAKDKFFQIVKEKEQIVFIEKLAELKYNPAKKYLQSLEKKETKFGQKKKIAKIMEYAYYGKNKQLKKIIDDNADVDFQDKNGESALSVASEMGQKDTVQLLLKNGANTNLKRDSGFTALMFASGKANEGIVRLLLENGTDVNTWSKDMGLTALTFAASTDSKNIVELLLKYGADVDQSTFAGDTPLMFAIQQQKSEIVKILIENGADVNAQRIDGQTPLMFAAEKHQYNLMKLLLENGSNPNLQREDGVTVLMLAYEYKQINIAELLLSYGADANIKNKKGLSALNIATKQGFNNNVNVNNHN